LCNSTTISLKALSNDLLSLLFIVSKLWGLTYCPIKCSRSTFHPPAYTFVFQIGILGLRGIVGNPFYLVFKVVTIEKLDTFKASHHNFER
jgi:hypothetical protein